MILFRMISSIMLLLGFSTVASAMGTVILTWNANSEPDLAGYRVYYGNASRHYTTQHDVGNVTQITIDNIAENTPYYFAVTAYDTAGNESAYSEEAFIILNSHSGGDTTRVNLHSYNFPNPFDPAQQVTTIRYYLEEPAEVSLTIYDLRNSLVRSLLIEVPKSAGEHTEEVWDGRDETGAVVANGDYFCEVRTPKFRHYVKITVISR